MLINKLNSEDQKIFNFNVKRINWPSFIEKYCLGAKRFILKEDIGKIDKARKSLKRINRTFFITKAIIVLTLIRFFLLRKYSLKKMFMFIFKLALTLRSYFGF